MGSNLSVELHLSKIVILYLPHEPYPESDAAVVYDENKGHDTMSGTSVVDNTSKKNTIALQNHAHVSIQRRIRTILAGHNGASSTLGTVAPTVAWTCIRQEGGSMHEEECGNVRPVG